MFVEENSRFWNISLVQSTVAFEHSSCMYRTKTTIDQIKPILRLFYAIFFYRCNVTHILRYLVIFDRILIWNLLDFFTRSIRNVAPITRFQWLQAMEMEMKTNRWRWLGLINHMLWMFERETRFTLRGVNDDFKRIGRSFDPEFRYNFLDIIVKM